MRWLDEFDDDHGCPARRTHVGVVRGVVGIDGRWRVFGVVGGVLTQERQDPSQGSCPQVVGEEPEVADAVESWGQDMDEKATDELIGGQSHGLVSFARFGPIVLALEGDAVPIVGDETAVGDRDPVGVAREVCEDGRGA